MAEAPQGSRAHHATLRNIAQRAGVSAGTVSRVLNNKAGVDEQLQARVLHIATEMGYIPRTRSGAKRVGMFLRELEPSADHNAYFSRIIYGAQAECRRRGWQFVFGSIGEGADAHLEFSRAIHGAQLDGLILENVLRREVVEMALGTGLPVVVVDDDYPDLPIECVNHDAYGGALTAVRYLLAQGHRRIGLLAGPVEHVNVRRRIAAYRDALGEAGLTYDAALVAECDLSVDGGERATALFLARRPAVTALFCSNDSSAIGALRALRASGVAVPGDISVLGFDDIEAARLVSPALTTVRVAAEAVGAAAVQALSDRFHHPQRPYSTRLLHTSLIVRESVCRACVSSASSHVPSDQNEANTDESPQREAMTASNA
jgi:DNA-binding LacI/PurR family transcriptional regulator